MIFYDALLKFEHMLHVVNVIRNFPFQYMRTLGKCQEKLDEYRFQGLRNVSYMCNYFHDKEIHML